MMEPAPLSDEQKASLDNVLRWLQSLGDGALGRKPLHPGSYRAILEAAIARLEWCELELATCQALLADLAQDVSAGTEAVYRAREREACAQHVEARLDPIHQGDFAWLAKEIRARGPTLPDHVARDRDVYRAALEEIVRVYDAHYGWDAGRAVVEVARKTLSGKE